MTLPVFLNRELLGWSHFKEKSVVHVFFFQIIFSQNSYYAVSIHLNKGLLNATEYIAVLDTYPL